MSDSLTQGKRSLPIDDDKHFINRAQFSNRNKIQSRLKKDLTLQIVENQTMTNVSSEDEASLIGYQSKHIFDLTHFNETYENFLLPKLDTNSTSGFSNITATKLFNIHKFKV